MREELPATENSSQQSKQNPPTKARPRVLSPGSDSVVGRILTLQRAIGNRAVQRFFSSAIDRGRLNTYPPSAVNEVETGSSRRGLIRWSSNERAGATLRGAPGHHANVAATGRGPSIQRLCADRAAEDDKLRRRGTSESLASRELFALNHLIDEQFAFPTREPTIQKQNDEEQSCGPLGRIKVDEMYQLRATGGTERYRIAIIGRRGELPIFAKVYHIGDWLNDEMVIVDIPWDSISVIVVHCDHQEILVADPRELPCAAPEIIVHVENGKLGHGTVKIARRCQEVCFDPADKLKPSLAYTLDAGAGLWVLQDGKGGVTAYPTSQLEDMLGVHLQDENCGKPKTEEEVVEPAPNPEEDWEQIFGP